MLQDPYDSPLSAVEFVSQYSQPPKDTDGAAMKRVKELNTQLLKDFVGVAFPKDGLLLRSEASQLWRIYSDGIEVRKYMEEFDPATLPFSDALEKAEEFFEQSIDEIFSAGHCVIVHNYTIIEAYKTRNIMREKYNRVFSNQDPSTWFEKAKTFREDIREKDRKAHEKFKALSLGKLYI